MTHLTFTKRRLEKITIERVDKGSLLTTDHTGFGIPEHAASTIKAGDELYVEFYKFNEIGGLMLPNGEYLFHRSDDYFIIQHQEFLEDLKRRNAERYEKNKDDYLRRTAALSPRYKARIERFLEESEEFQTESMGWGYELVVCELAMLYEKSEGTDSPEVLAFAAEQGTSGNQHNVAKSWAKFSDQEL